jgi:hypothetical protein
MGSYGICSNKTLDAISTFKAIWNTRNACGMFKTRVTAAANPTFAQDSTADQALAVSSMGFITATLALITSPICKFTPLLSSIQPCTSAHSMHSCTAAASIYSCNLAAMSSATALDKQHLQGYSIHCIIQSYNVATSQGCS